jgi:hypothetical protein
MYKINFFVPLEHSTAVKNAMFEKGAGKIGNYDCCSFETLGTGQFRPLEGSDAFIGKVGEVEKVEELKVEMVCEESIIKEVIQAMRDAHPYETPAYDVWKTETF